MPRFRQIVGAAITLAFALVAFADSSPNCNVTVLTTSRTLNVGFVRWVSRHPITYEEPTIDLTLPSLDVFAGGVSVYHGNDPTKNAAFLDGLPESANHLVSDCFRPTLKETVEMFPELNEKRSMLLSGTSYTVVGMTDLGKEDGRKQHKTLEDLKRRSGKMGIQVVEILVR